MRVAGCVLAAGASRRMGSPKALLQAGGRTFLAHMCSALSEGGSAPVLAVVSPALLEACRAIDLGSAKLVLNPDPDRGQISSLGVALAALRDPAQGDAGEPPVAGLVVVTVDQGRLAAGSVRSVRELLREAAVVVARYNAQEGHPVGFHRSQFSALLSAEAQAKGARAVVEAARRNGELKFADVDDPGVVRNLNTPEELRAAKPELGR